MLGSVVFALVNVMLPIMIQTRSIGGLLVTYGSIQLIGRLQGLLLFPKLQELRYRGLSTHYSLSTPLIAMGARRQLASNILWRANKQSQDAETIMLLLIPQITGMLIRTLVITSLYPEQTLLAINLLLGGVIIVCLISYATKQQQQDYLQALKQQEAFLQQVLHHDDLSACITKHTGDRLYRIMIKRELLKVGIGILGIAALGVSIIHQPEMNMLQTLLWLGYGDHFWGVWSALSQIEKINFKKALKKREQQEPIMELRVDNLLLANHSGPYEFSLSRGDAICVIGNNGSGKTLLFKTLLGDAKYQGNIWVNGESRTFRNSDRILIQGAQSPLTVGQVGDYFSMTEEDSFGLKKQILALPKQIETPLVDAYTIWSQGTIQLFGLHYACQKTADVWILDEACSHLSLENELLVYKTIRSLPHSPILLFASHALPPSKIEEMHKMSVLNLSGS